MIDKGLQRDLRVLARFIDLYCRERHIGTAKVETKIKGYNVDAIAGRELHLCHSCSKLLSHAFVKRSTCPLEPKPACKKCPEHCYQPTYREQIREVMKYSGRRLILSGRLDYLFHLLF